MLLASVLGLAPQPLPLAARSPALRWRSPACMESSSMPSADDESSDERFVTDPAVLSEAGVLWALLFNAGSGNEGIYSRRHGEGAEAVDYILAFQDEDDASRYAGLLEATDFPLASPAEVEAEALLEFCTDGGHVLAMVRRGTVVMPPETSVSEFDCALHARPRAAIGLAPHNPSHSCCHLPQGALANPKRGGRPRRRRMTA